MDGQKLIGGLVERRSDIPNGRAMLVGISGIDGGGKGYVANHLADELIRRGFRVAVTNVDGWLNLREVRFDSRDLAGNFYRNGIRMDELFERLILPLKEVRSVSITADFTEETAAEYAKHTYSFENIDIILLEGIFLFKRPYVDHFDVKIWIECSFETALKRAVARSQEGLPPYETVREYESIYFPAQELHFHIDHPIDAADVIFNND